MIIGRLSPKRISAERISPMRVLSGRVFAPSVVALLLLSLACDSGSSRRAPQPVGADIDSIAVQSASSTPLPRGRTRQFTALATLADGSTRDITGDVTWTSSDSSVLAFSTDPANPGLAFAVGEGTVEVSSTDAASGVVSAPVSVEVVPAAADSLSISPSIVQALPAGQSQRFVVTAVLSDGTTGDLTALANWISSDPSVAAFSTDPGEEGLLLGLGPGDVTVRAELPDGSAVSNDVPLTVSSALLQDLTVTPQIIPSLPIGRTQQLVATGTFSDGTVREITESVQWSSANSGIALVSNFPGSRGLVRGIGVGQTTLQSRDPTSGFTSARVEVDVRNAVLDSLSIASTSGSSVPAGRQLRLIATGMFSDSTTRDLSSTSQWSSSNDAVASVDSDGVVTGNAEGVAMISAADAATGVRAPAFAVRITSSIIDAITIEPAAPMVPVGSTLELRAIGVFSDGTTGDVTEDVTWASTVEAVAVVSNAEGEKGLVSGLQLGVSTVIATDPVTRVNSTPPAVVEVTEAIVSSISITPAAEVSVPIGRTQQYTATGELTDGTTRDLTESVTWSSSLDTVAVISNADGTRGLASIIGVGRTEFSATDPATGVVSASVVLIGTEATLESLAITPAAEAVLPAGQGLAYTATGTFSDGLTRDLTESVTWTSTDELIVRVSNLEGQRGSARAVSPGRVEIGATEPTTGTLAAPVFLSVVDATLVSLELTPVAPADLIAGRALQMTATGIFSDASTQDLTESVTWLSSDETVAPVSNAAGGRGIVMGLAPGTTTLTALETSSSIVSPPVVITVIDAVLESIGITPAGEVTLSAGRSQQFAAVGVFSDGSSSDITESVTWSSSAELIASVSNAAGSRGFVTGLGPGSATITATDVASAIQSSPVDISVTNAALESIAVTPALPEALPEGHSVRFAATGTFSDGSTRDLSEEVTWRSGTESVVTISNADGSRGLATGVSIGQTSVTALDPASGVTSDAIPLLVVEATLESFVVSPGPSVELLAGQEQQFFALGSFSDGSIVNMTETVTWSSSVPAVVSISNVEGSRGLASALAVGSSQVTARDPVSGITSTPVTLTVGAAVLQSIAVSPGPTVGLPAGNSVGFTATGSFSDGSSRDVTAEVTWTSSNETVAVVSNAQGTRGLATALTAGLTMVHATDPETSVTSDAVELSVAEAELLSIGITPATNIMIAVGRTEQLTATGIFSDGSTSDLTDSVTWASSDEGFASISNAAGSSGLVSALGMGTASITARDSTSGIVSPPVEVVVTDAVLVSLAVTPSVPANLPVGRTESFDATGTFSDGSTRDLTQSVTWTSSNPGIAAVSNAAGQRGVTTALAVGAVDIVARDVSSGIESSAVLLSCVDAVLESLDVTPSGTVNLRVGEMRQFLATGTFSDGQVLDITSSVTWETSQPNRVTISNANGSRGLATALGTGHAEIVASDSVSGLGSSPVNIEVGEATLTSISISPGSASVPQGCQVAFAASGTFSDGSTRDVTDSVTWMSGDDGIATVSNAPGSRGLATGVSTGAVDILALDPDSGRLSGPAVLTVTAATLESIATMPGPTVDVVAGNLQSFTATGTFSDGSTVDLTESVTWSSSEETVATISNVSGSRGLAVTMSPGTTQIRARDVASGIESPAVTLNVTDAVLTSIAVTPSPSHSMPQGSTVEFTATGTFSNGSTDDLTESVTWISSNPAIANISNAVGSRGLVTGISTGSVQITARDGASGIESTPVSLTITAATLESIAVTPGPSVDVVLGNLQPFTATGTFSDGSTLDLTELVTWSSSDEGVATISNASGSRGFAGTVATGTTEISARDAASGIRSPTVTMNVTAAGLTMLSVTPAPSVSVPQGCTVAFTATGTFSNGSTSDLTESVTWSSSDQGVASVSNAPGTRGLATGVLVGDADISAFDPDSGIGSTAVVLTVTAATLESIAVTPGPTVDVVLGNLQPFTATGTFSDGSTLDLTEAVTWSSSDEGVAIISNASGSSGFAATASPGSTQITALDVASGIVSPAVTLNVNAATLTSLAVTPGPSVDLPAGQQQSFTATGTFSDGSTSDLTETVTWSSSDLDIAIISNAAGSRGIATGIDVGTSSISALDPGSSIESTAITLNIIDATLVSIVVTPSSASIAIGQEQAYTATGNFSDGSTSNLSDSVTWSSSDPGVASVSNAAGTRGIASAVSVGNTQVQAQDAASGITSAAVSLEITAAILESIAIDPGPSVSVPLGESQQFAATGSFSDGSTLDLTDSVTWMSSDVGVASISNAAGSEGLASSAAPGTTTITAMDVASGISSGDVSLEVLDAVLESISVTPGPAVTIGEGGSQQFSATGSFSDGSTADLTDSVTWMSSLPGVATVSNAAGTEGLASAVAPGDTQISAMDPTTAIVSGSVDLTVEAAILQNLSISPTGPLNLPLGRTQQFTATGSFSDGSMRDLTDSVTWQSSSSAIVSISNAAGSEGLATAQSIGIVTVDAFDGDSGISSNGVALSAIAAVLESIEVTPNPVEITRTWSRQMTATGTFSDGLTSDLTNIAFWSTADPSVAVASNLASSRGVVTALDTVGSTTVVAQSGPITSAAATVDVTDLSAAYASASAVLVGSCGVNSSCHVPATPGGLANGVDFTNACTTWETLVAVDSAACPGETFVVPGSLANSYLVDKLTVAPACGSDMATIAGLTATEITAIRDWVSAGAPD